MLNGYEKQSFFIIGNCRLHYRMYQFFYPAAIACLCKILGSGRGGLYSYILTYAILFSFIYGCAKECKSQPAKKNIPDNSYHLCAAHQKRSLSHY